MLGYVKPEKPELKIKEYELYRGYYCSLCKALGKKYGVLSRLFLSYDVTFFLIFVYGLKKECSLCFQNGRCPFNPGKKCHYADTDSYEFDFATSFSVIMTYYKLKDNILDASFFSSIKYRLLLPIIYFKYKKAKSRFPQIDNIISKSIDEQAFLEKEKCDIADKSADPSAKALGECFKLFSDSAENERLYYRFGYCLGRYVYLIDAFDDMDKDKKNNSYNVFVLNGYSNDEIIQVIRMTVNELILCFDLFEFYTNKDIIANIVRLGLENQLCAVIKKREGSK